MNASTGIHDVIYYIVTHPYNILYPFPEKEITNNVDGKLIVDIAQVLMMGHVLYDMGCVMPANHGTNIISPKDIDFDLSQKTGGYNI